MPYNFGLVCVPDDKEIPKHVLKHREEKNNDY